MDWIWCHNINLTYQTNVMSLLNFFTTLRQGCGIVTIWPWIVHILHFLTLRRRCEFAVAVTTLYRRYHYDIHDMLQSEFTIQCWGNAGRKLWIWRRSIDVGKTNVAISTLQQRCQYNFKVHCKLIFYYPMLKQYQSNSIILTLWHKLRCNVAYWLYDAVTLSQSCQKAACSMEQRAGV